MKLSHCPMQCDDVTRCAQVYKEGACKQLLCLQKAACRVRKRKKQHVKWRYNKSWENKNNIIVSKGPFKPCVPPCLRFIKPGDEHKLCVICLGVEQPRSALEGVGCAHCDKFSLKKLLS